MFVEVSYTDGGCPLCGGAATGKTHLDRARDLTVNGATPSYSNFVTYSARCHKCFLMWYVRTYSWIDNNKNGMAVRRNYIDYKDYIALKPMFIDMAYCDAELLEKDMNDNASV